MTRNTRASSRALSTAASVTAVFSIGLFAGAPAAWAHVQVDSDHAQPGAETVLTFEVPGESDSGALTTQFSVALPNPTSAQAELMPGWTAQLDRDLKAGTVRSVTWTAAPGVGIPTDQFALFHIAATLPDSDTASYPATQTYSDGTVVRWDEPTLPAGGEPEHPVPTLKLTSGQPAGQPTAPTADNTALWVAVAGVVIGAAGVALGLLNWRRRS
jgi:uncharacterized protein YcnI